MKDIKNILDPVNERYFGAAEGMDFYGIYKEIVGMESLGSKDLVKDVIKKYNVSREAFNEQSDEDKKILQDFTFICLLSFDVFVKKMMIEQFIAEHESNDGSKEDSMVE